MVDFDHFEKRTNEAEDMINKMIRRVDALEKQRRSLENELADLKQKLASKKDSSSKLNIDINFLLCCFFLL